MLVSGTGETTALWTLSYTDNCRSAADDQNWIISFGVYQASSKRYIGPSTTVVESNSRGFGGVVTEAFYVRSRYLHLPLHYCLLLAGLTKVWSDSFGYIVF